MDLKTYKPTICPLFRKFNIQNNIQELKTYINSLDNNYKYIIHCVCPFEIKEEVKQYLDTEPKILNNRLNVKVTNKENIDNNNIVNINLQSNIDITQTFKEFLDTIELKYPKQLYLDILQED